MVRKVNIVVGEPKSENDGSLVSCSESRQNGVHVQTLRSQNFWGRAMLPGTLKGAEWQDARGKRLSSGAGLIAAMKVSPPVRSGAGLPGSLLVTDTIVWTKNRTTLHTGLTSPADTLTARRSLAVVLAMHIVPAWAVCSWT